MQIKFRSSVALPIAGAFFAGHPSLLPPSTATFRKPNVIAIWCGVFIAGLLAGAWAWNHENKLLLEEFRADAERCAIAIDLADVQALTGLVSDQQSPHYHRVKSRLKQLHAVHPSVRFVYIFRHIPATGAVIYLADSEPPHSTEESLPGDVFPEAPHMPGLQLILKTGQTTTEGPVKDSFGVFMTAYSRIGAPEERLGPVREVLGLDIHASRWRRAQLNASLSTAVYIWLLAGLPVMALMIRSRHISRQAMIGRLSQAVEQSQNAIAVIGLQGVVEYVNAGFCRQTGYKENELVGRRWLELKAGSTPPITFERLSSRVRAGEVWEGEWMGTRKNGETYPIRGTLSPVKSDSLDVTGYIAVLVDMSEVRHRETELRISKEQAEQANKAKGYFLAIMSHEVYTPLNAIAGFSSLLQDSTLAPEQLEYVRTIRRSSEALIHLTRDMLDYSRIESRGLDLEPSPCDIVGLVEDVLDIFSVDAAEKGVAIHHSFDRELPAQLILDGGRLRQILVNLIGNALKFTTKGSIDLRINVATPPPGEQLMNDIEDGSIVLEFFVRDSGIGIASEDRQRLFQPFTQLDESSARRFGSVGIGLAISKHLVELMGGHIDFQSTEGQGSCFHFSVRGSRIPNQLAAWPNLQGTRVAVVASHDGTKNEIVHVLRLAGAEPQICKVGDMPTANWDFGVVDCALDEATLLKTIAHPQWRNERAIGLISPLCSSETRKVLRRGFRMLLHKPFHHRTILELMMKTLEIQESRPPFPHSLGLRVMAICGNDVQQNLLGKILDHLGCERVTASSEPLARELFSQWKPTYVILRLQELEWDTLSLVRHLRANHDAHARKPLHIIALTADTEPMVLKMARAAGVDDFVSGAVTLGAIEAVLRWRS